MEGPTVTRAAVDRLRERRDSAERTFDRTLSRLMPTARLWREWRDAPPAKKAAAYERLRSTALAHPSLGGLVIMREGAIEDHEAAEAAFRRMSA